MDQTYKLLSRIAELEESRSSVNRDIKVLRRVVHEALTASVPKPFVPHVLVVRPHLIPTVPLRQQLHSVSAPVQTQHIHLPLPEDQLAGARKEFIADLAKKKEQDESFAVIVPELERLWKAKMPQFCTMPNFVGYLLSYNPKLLCDAICRMAKVTVEIVNPPSYFHGIVHDLRRRELKREEALLVVNN